MVLPFFCLLYKPKRSLQFLINFNSSRFDFTSDARIRDTVESAKRKFTNRLSEVAFDAFKFEKFGKKACKSANVGPDSVMQLAFQIAYHKLTGTFVPTYESCSTVSGFF